MIDWIKKVISDESGNQSSKRVIAITGSIILFVSHLFCLNPNPAVVEGTVWVICIGLGATSLDKFSAKKGA